MVRASRAARALRLGDVVGVDDVAHVGRREIFGARRAFAPALAAGDFAVAAAALDVIGHRRPRPVDRRPAIGASDVVRRFARRR